MFFYNDKDGQFGSKLHPMHIVILVYKIDVSMSFFWIFLVSRLQTKSLFSYRKTIVVDVSVWFVC